MPCRVVEGNRQDQERLRGIAEQAERELQEAAAALEATQTQHSAAEAAATRFQEPAMQARGRHAALLQELEDAK